MQNVAIWLYLSDGIHELCVEPAPDLIHGQTRHQGVLDGVHRGRGGTEITGWTNGRLAVGEKFIAEEVPGKEL